MKTQGFVSCLTVLRLGILLGLSGSFASADVFVWATQNGGSFGDKQNWALADGTPAKRAPGGGDTACIGGGNGASVCGIGGATGITAPITLAAEGVDTLNLGFTTLALSATFTASTANLGSATLIGTGTFSASVLSSTFLTVNGPTLRTSGEGQFSGLTVSQGTVSTASAAVGNLPTVVDSGGSSWNSGMLSDSATADVTIQNGGQLTSSGTEIDHGSLFTVTGPSSTWTLSQLNVAAGKFVIKDSGRINSGEVYFGIGTAGAARTTEITIDGAASTWGFGGPLHLEYDPGSTTLLNLKNSSVLTLEHDTTVGEGGSSYVNIDTGAKLQVSGSVTQFGVGYEAGSDGHLSVSGAGSLLELDGLSIVGVFGSGSISVNGGAAIQTDILSVGSGIKSDGTLSVSGAGSTFTVSDSLFLGDEGSGTLFVRSGGVFHVARPKTKIGVGRQPSGVGALAVSDAGSQLVLDGLTIIGVDGMGRVSVSQGGTVQSSIVELGDAAGASGSIDITGSGSDWTDTDNLFVGGIPDLQPAGEGTVTVTGNATMTIAHTLSVSGSGTVTADNTGKIAVGSGGFGPPGSLRLTTGGQLTGRGIIRANVVQGGLLSPGNSPGLITIDGDFQQESGGTLEIQITGSVPATQYDVLKVTGKVMLGGVLSLQFMNGFSPKAGQIFQFLQYGTNVAGSFGQVVITGLTSDFQYSVKDSGAGAYSLVAINDGIPTSPPNLSVVRTGTQIEVSWPVAVTGYMLQSTTNLTTGPWNSETANANTFITLPNVPAKFFRLIKP